MTIRRPILLLVLAAVGGAAFSACSPAAPPAAPPPAPPPVATATAVPEPPGPPEFVSVDAHFTSLPDEHRWAPNGAVVAIDDAMHRVLLWDAAAGAPRGLLGPFPERPMAIAWSRDGERIALREGPRAHVFALRDGAVVGAFEAASKDDPMLFSQDGKALHFLFLDGRLVTQDAATGAEIARVSFALPAHAKVVAWDMAPEGSRLALALQGGDAPHVGVWNAQDGRRLASFDDGSGDLTWAEDGESIYLHPVGARTATVRVRVGGTPEKLPSPVPLPGRPRFEVKVEPGQGTSIATLDGARLPGPLSDEQAEAPLGAALERVRFNPDATELVTHRLRGVDRWDLRTGRLLASLPIDPVYISKNARHALVAAPGDGARVQLVDVTTGQPRLTLVSEARETGIDGRYAESEAARRLAVVGVPDGPRPARWPDVAGAVRHPETELVTLIDPESAAVERVIGGAGAKITNVELCADGKLVATGHERGKDGRAPLHVWSAADGKRRLDVPEGTLQACSSDGAVVVVFVRAEVKKADAKKAKGRTEPPGAKKSKPRSRLDFHDARTQRRLSSIEVNGDHPSFYLSPDGSLAALLGNDEPEVVIWDVRAGKRRATLPGKAHSGFATWSPSGAKLAVAAEPANVYVWDARTGGAQPLAGGQRFCHQLRWSSDEKRLMVARNAGLDPAGRAAVEIFGEHGERLDQQGRTFGIPFLRPALLVVDEPNGTRTHHDGFGLNHLGVEAKGSVLASWRAEDVIADPFIHLATSKDGKYWAVDPLGVPAVIRVEDGATIVFRPFTVGSRRVGVATSADGHFTGDPEAFGRLTFRRGHWLRGPLVTGREVSDHHDPALLTAFFAGQ